MVVASRVASTVAANCARKSQLSQTSMRKPSAQIAEKKKEEAQRKHAEQQKKSLPRKLASGVLSFLDQTWLQTLQYIVFLFAFQSLTGTIRKPEEFYFDKYLTDTFIK